MQTRLKEARKGAGFSQQEAAVALKVSIGTYRNWEQGRVIMNGEQLIKASQLFSATVDFILMTDTGAASAKNPEDELMALYNDLDADGREALLIVARGLAQTFHR